MQRRRALGAAVAALALATTGVVVARGGDGDDRPPPLLRLLAHPPTSDVRRPARERTLLPSVDLPELGGESPAYRLDAAGHGRARLDELAEVFGIEGEAVEYAPGDLQVVDDELDLIVSRGDWTMSRSRVIPSLPDAATRGPGPLDGDDATHDGGPGPGGAMPVPLEADAVEELPGLPSEEEARRIALDTLESTGMDTDDATIRAENGRSAWLVDVEPRVDGLPAPGLVASVTVGPGGRIDGASGIVDGIEELGRYPLAGTRAAVDRLNGDWSSTPPLYDTVTEDIGGPEVEVTSAELVVTRQLGWDGTTYLVPSYRMVADDDHVETMLTLAVPAVTDDVIDRGLDQAALAARPEREDLGQPPTIRNATGENAVVVAPVNPCGIDDVWWGDYRFAALDPPFDATDAPDEYTGVGELAFYTGVYTDDSGIVVRFTEVDPGREPPRCDGQDD